jgi:cell pole-organizing protein PopZ
MEPIRKYLLACMVLLPSIVMAATDCQVIEYPDHYDAVCVGDEKPGSEQAQTPLAVQAPVEAQAPAAKKALKAVSAPVAAQSSLAAYAPVAAQAPAVQASAAVQGNTPVTGQTDAAKVSVAMGQRRSDIAVSNAVTASKTRVNGKISFLTRMRDNLALSNMPRN